MANEEPRVKKQRWGVGLAVLYGGFVLFTLALVLFASLQDFSLVEDDYYEKELAYQQQIDKAQRAQLLPQQPTIEYRPDDQAVVLSFPTELPLDSIQGSLWLFRASNARWDRVVPIELDVSGRQSIPAAAMVKGKWTAKLDWKLGDDEYYSEEMLYVE